MIVEPAYSSFAKFLPHVQQNLDNIAENKSKWKTLVLDYQDRVIKAQEYFQAHPPNVYVEEDKESEESEDEPSKSYSQFEKTENEGNEFSSRKHSIKEDE